MGHPETSQRRPEPEGVDGRIKDPYFRGQSDTSGTSPEAAMRALIWFPWQGAMLTLRIASVVILTFAAGCGGNRGSGSSAAQASPSMAQGLAAATVLATHRGEVAPLNAVRMFVGTKMDDFMLARVVERMSPGDPRGATASVRNWIALGREEDRPFSLLVDSFLYHLVIETTTSGSVAGTDCVRQLAGLLGLPTASDGLPDPVSLAHRILPGPLYPEYAQSLVEHFNHNSPEALVNQALDYLSAEISLLREVGQDARSRQQELLALEYRDRVLSVAAGAKALLSEMGSGPQSAGRLLEGLATLAVTGSQLQFAVLPQTDLGSRSVRLWSGVGDFFSDVGDGVVDTLETAGEWVADSAETFGEWVWELANETCDPPDPYPPPHSTGTEPRGESCEFKVSLVSFKMQGALEQARLLSQDGFAHTQRALLGMDARISLTAGMIVGLHEDVGRLASRLEEINSAISSALAQLGAALSETRDLIRNVAQQVRADMALIRDDIASLKSLIAWYFDDQAKQAMEAEYLNYDLLAAQAISAARFGDEAGVDSALAQMRVYMSEASRGVFARNRPIETLEDCITELPTFSMMDRGAASHAGSAIGVAPTLGALVGASISAVEAVNLQALSYMANVYLHALSESRQLRRNFASDIAAVDEILSTARGDFTTLHQQLLLGAQSIMGATAPVAALELRDILRQSVSAYWHARGGLWSNWHDAGPAIDVHGDFRLPLRPVTGSVVISFPGSAGWVYRIGQQDYVVDGHDVVRMAANLGIVRIRAAHFYVGISIGFAYYLKFEFPSELLAVVPQLSPWNHEDFAYLGQTGGGQPSTIQLGPNMMRLQLSNTTLGVVKDVCEQAVNGLTRVVLEHDVLPRIAAPSATPAMRRLAGLTAIVRWSLTELQRYGEEDREISTQLIELLRSPLMSGSRLFCLEGIGAGSVAERYQAALAAYFVRLGNPATLLPEGFVHYQDAADGLEDLVAELDSVLNQDILPWLSSGGFWCAATDAPSLWLQRL